MPRKLKGVDPLERGTCVFFAKGVQVHMSLIICGEASALILDRVEHVIFHFKIKKTFIYNIQYACLWLSYSIWRCQFSRLE